MNKNSLGICFVVYVTSQNLQYCQPYHFREPLHSSYYDQMYMQMLMCISTSLGIEYFIILRRTYNYIRNIEMYEHFEGKLFWYNYSTSICFDKTCIVWVVGQDEVFYPLVVCYTRNVVQFSFQKCCAKYPQYLYYPAMKRKESYAGNIQIASILVCYAASG